MSEAPCHISIVIASLCDDRRAELLKRACESVRAAAGDHAYSILVVANGPRVSPAVRDWLVMRADTRVIRLRSGSHPLARRVGAEMVNSELLGFLDDDDELLPATLGRKISWFRGHPDADVLVTNGFRITESDCAPIFPPGEGDSDLIERMMQVGWSACSLTLRTGKVDLAVLSTEQRHLEWTLMALLLARRHQTGYLSEPMYRYYANTAGSLSKGIEHSLAAPEIWRRLTASYTDSPYLPAMRRRYSVECHNASWQHAQLGHLREAWRLHWESMRSPGGVMAYLPYSRKLLLASLRRARAR